MTFDPVAERTEYVRELTKLKLWHVGRLVNAEDIDFETAMSSRTSIGRMTVFWGNMSNKAFADPAGWKHIVEKLRSIFNRHSKDPTSEAIENECIEFLWPHLEPVIADNVAEVRQWLKTAEGCFRYEFTPYYADRESADHLTLHVNNAYQPDSMFEHVPELMESLKGIVARATRERPDVEWAQCGSWLNSLPPFADLFPPTWTEAAQPGQPGGHGGWWGQFMNRHGGFHVRNAERFRQTGAFPFRHLLSRCRIDEWREHLDKISTSA